MKRWLLLLGFATMLVSPGWAQDGPETEEKTFQIHPAKAPKPALQSSLLPSRGEQIAGDAAVFYHRAIESLIETRYREQLQALKRPDVGADSAETNAMDWLALPSDRFPRDDVRTLLERRSRALEETRLGTLRETCDWGFRRRSEGYELILSDMQEARGLGRWLALKARLDLEEGRIDEALQGVKTGLALSRDLGRSENYIQTLIAIAVANQMLDVLERLVQRPECPSLYWAVAALPRPLMDLAGPRESESAMLKREFPLLESIESNVWSIETARAFSDEVSKKLGNLIDDWPRSQSPLSSPALEDLPVHASFLILVSRAYPEARRSLRKDGFPEERLDAMPMVQLVGIASYREFEIVRDELAKWETLPFGLGVKGWAESSRQLIHRSTGIPFAALNPATRSVQATVVGLERRLALLLLVEGLRLHSASHDGALPASLDQLSDSPALPDPVSGMPFDYKLAGDATVETGPAPEGFAYGGLRPQRYIFRSPRTQASR